MNEKKINTDLLKKLLNKKQYYPESTVPEYAVHTDSIIKGFFGQYRYLSNFYACPNGIWYEELKYPTVEHAYQAAKIDSNNRLPFTTCNAKEVKRLGNVASIDKENWEKIKYNIMIQLVTQKFANHDMLRGKLLKTKDAYLEETNHWHDQYWGVCDGAGQNKLGQILMTVRNFWKE